MSVLHFHLCWILKGVGLFCMVSSPAEACTLSVCMYVEDKMAADLWLLNSCTVKSPAEDHFRNAIQHGRQLGKYIVLAGCVPQSQPKSGYIEVWTRRYLSYHILLVCPFKRQFSRWIWVSWYKNVSILGFVGVNDDGGGGDNCSYKIVKIVTTNKPTPVLFYRPDALPVAQPTMSEHWLLYLLWLVEITSNRKNSCLLCRLCLP